MSLSGVPGASPLLKAPDPLPQLLRDLVHEHTGIYFEPGRFDMMLEKLELRARAHRCQSYLDYYYILKYDDRRAEEWRHVMNAFSVQETYFWREFDQIQTLVDHIVPAWFARTSAPFRIWSAACATGEEPYSLVMALRERGWGEHPIEIFASDASESALAKARACVYRERSFRSLPSILKAKYFQPQGENFALDPVISSRVRFFWANLMDLDEGPAPAAVNVVFCRNVFIYFSSATIQRVAASFARRIPAQGHLFIGASESLLRLTSQFDLEEIGSAFSYVRNEAPALVFPK